MTGTDWYAYDPRHVIASAPYYTYTAHTRRETAIARREAGAWQVWRGWAIERVERDETQKQVWRISTASQRGTTQVPHHHASKTDTYTCTMMHGLPVWDGVAGVLAVSLAGGSCLEWVEGDGVCVGVNAWPLVRLHTGRERT